MRRVNLFDANFETDPEDPEGYRAAMARVSQELGADELTLKAFLIPPGEDLCPYHYEYVEEWLLVLEGEVAVRTPEGEDTVGCGGVVRFPAGPQGAHKVMNRGQEPTRLVMFSRIADPSVAVYPDSDKLGVRMPDDRVMFHRADGNVDYFDGEA